jgi:hypothetical protein
MGCAGVFSRRFSLSKTRKSMYPDMNHKMRVNNPASGIVLSVIVMHRFIQGMIGVPRASANGGALASHTAIASAEVLK